MTVRILSLNEVHFLLNLADDWETPCPSLTRNHSDSGALAGEPLQHCACWYDGEACCGCGEGEVEND